MFDHLGTFRLIQHPEKIARTVLIDQQEPEAGFITRPSDKLFAIPQLRGFRRCLTEILQMKADEVITVAHVVNTVPDFRQGNAIGTP